MDYLQLLPLEDSLLDEIADNAKDFALMQGIGMRTKDLPYDARVNLPFCLCPSPFPQRWFQFAKSIQADINLLINNVSHDYEFMKTCLKSTVEVDDFTAKLFNIYETVLKEGPSQMLNLGLLRSDYMININPDQEPNIKQVEINTISAGFAGMTSKLTSLHKYVLNMLGVKTKEDKLCISNAVHLLAEGLIAAWEAYGQKDAVVLFVVEDVTYNICDQRALEFAMNEHRRDIQVIRRKFSDISQRGKIHNNCLFLDGKEIAIVYFRTGYGPEQYKPEDWKMRLMVERSKAIKCPSAQYHLAGTKKIQQALSLPEVLEKFLPTDAQAVSNVRQVFVNQYSLEMNEEGDNAVSLALKLPESFVMKPQREGGGHNIYGMDIKTTLEKIGTSKEREQYILMERILPPAIPNYVISRDSQPRFCQTISELGVYGVILGTKDDIITNYEAGHLLRSKPQGNDEGGISAGFGALDSAFLI